MKHMYELNLVCDLDLNEIANESDAQLPETEEDRLRMKLMVKR